MVARARVKSPYLIQDRLADFDRAHLRAEAPPAASQPPAPTPPQREPVAAVDPAPPPPRTPPPAEPLRRTDGFLSITNHLLDDIFPSLAPHEAVVLLRLYRLSWGFGSPRCNVSLSKLSAKTGVKKTKLREALAVLEGRGLVRRLADDVGSADYSLRGMWFEVTVEPVRQANPSVSRTPPSGEGNKIKALKVNSQNCSLCGGVGHYFENPADPSTWKICRHDGEGE